MPPRKRTISPLFDPSLWRLWREGADNAKRLCQAKSQRASSSDATCSQGMLSGVSNCLTRAQNKKKEKKERMDRIYFLDCNVKAFSMQRTMQEPEQLLEVCCRRWPLFSDDARPVTARSPARHVSQQWSVCRWPLLLDPCQTIFSGLEERKNKHIGQNMYTVWAHRKTSIQNVSANQQKK